MAEPQVLLNGHRRTPTTTSLEHDTSKHPYV